jgi:hypothetical protein
MVLTLPKSLCDELKIEHGSLVDFNLQEGREFALFSVLLRKDGSRGGDTSHTHCGDCKR